MLAKTFTGLYDPPVSQDDPRVCGNCRRYWGSRIVPPRPGHFSVLNTLTGKYHSSMSNDGLTDCKLDATEDGWMWPL